MNMLKKSEEKPLTAMDYVYSMLKEVVVAGNHKRVSDKILKPFRYKNMVRPARFERATYGLEGRCSILLSYGRVKACKILKAFLA